jgi:hypothetical protein
MIRFTLPAVSRFTLVVASLCLVATPAMAFTQLADHAPGGQVWYDTPTAKNKAISNPFDLIRHVNLRQSDKQTDTLFSMFFMQKSAMNDVVQDLEAQPRLKK